MIKEEDNYRGRYKDGDPAAEKGRMEAIEALRREQGRISGESGQLVLWRTMFKIV